MPAEAGQISHEEPGWVEPVINQDDNEPALPGPGSPCPQCKHGMLDYDGMLNLTCNRCGYSLSGCFT
jgi:hypothetical protein